MKCKARQWLCLLLVLTIVGSSGMVARAKEKEIVRVGYYPIEGFIDEEAGRLSGYGISVLNKVADYLNITFVYKKAANLEDARQLLLDHEVDIVLPVMKNDLFDAEEFYVGYVSIFESSYALLCKEEREDLNYGDKKSIKKLKVGITRENYNSSGMKLYMKEMWLSDKQISVYEEPGQIQKDMAQGKIDAVIADMTHMERGLKLLARFGYSGNYLVSCKDYDFIRKIEDAIGVLKVQEPEFWEEIIARYYPRSLYNPVTQDELDYIRKLKGIQFVTTGNQGYYIHKGKEMYSGIYPAIVKELENRLGITCELRVESAQRMSELLNRVVSPASGLLEEDLDANDVIIDFYADKRFASFLNVSMTGNYIDRHYYEIYRKGETEDDPESKVAVVKGDKAVLRLLDNFYTNKVLSCKDSEECLEKVRKGEADVTIMDTRIAEYYLPEYQNANLTISFRDEDGRTCMASRDTVLISVLDKILREMNSDGTLQRIIEKEEMDDPVQSGFIAHIYNNPQQSIKTILLVGSLGLVILTLLVVVYRIRKKNEFLTKMSEAKTDFMSRMSHDIRTPMNGVLGMAHLAREEEDIPEKVDEYLGKIEGAGEYLLGLINDILDMTKLSSGKIVFNYEIVDMRKLAAELQQILLSTFKERGVELVCDFSQVEFPYIRTDPMRMMQIISNLLGNAVKFTPAGRHVYWCAKSCKINDRQVETVTIIRDEGCGMSDEFLKKLYEPFEQEENLYSKGSNGTGLGLAIVKNLVDQMGGTIQVDSKLNVGTTFTIRFVREKGEAFEIMPKTEPKETKNLEGVRVLIVEDQPLNQEILKGLLAHKGIETTVADNGKEALELIQSGEETFDLIFMDIRMPVMDGITAARRIRELPEEEARQIPIIALTANAFEDDKEATREAGMNGHLAKPIHPRELFETIEKFL